MDMHVFQQFQTLIYDQSGISLKEGKEALVAARIGKRIRELSLPDEKSYLRYLKDDATGEELIQLLDAISTNVTQFFREPDHFTFMEDTLKQWAEEGQKRFRFWSAACSTGQEPYSIALSAASTLLPYRTDTKILATDICTRVLKTGMSASYTHDHLKQIPVRYHSGAFIRDRQSSFEFTDEIKRLIVFSRLNLSSPPFPMRGPFDMIFCRNVMIYFDNPVRTRLVTELFRLLKPKGYLMVGHSETLTGLSIPLRPVKPSIYIKEEEL
jgi:chemotaxis protein methyltransferase CheR